MPELYFAYGSNMYGGRMTRRCPSARFRYRAALRDHVLAFPRGCHGGHGVAGVVPQPGEVVWGVVYKITDDELDGLDMAEGYFGEGDAENCYTRERTEVLRDNDPEQTERAHVYFAVPEDEPPLPSMQYLGYIVEGAIQWGLPEDYIAKLEAIETA